jgi:adenosylhomocysteine nucleosidase
MQAKIVVVISANTEWQIVRELIPSVEVQTSPYGEWVEIDISQSPDIQFATAQPIAFFHQGWGKIAAAGATQYVIDRWQPDLLINLGTCGGFEGSIEKFAIVLVEKTIVYDIIEQMGDYDEHIAHYTTEIDLSWLSEPYPQDVVRTLLVSGDRDLIVEEIPKLEEKYGAVAGDWESGAIAWVAARNSIPCLILRGVTDLVGGDGGEAYEGNFDVFVEGTRTVMKDLLSMLPAWVERFAKTSAELHPSIR